MHAIAPWIFKERFVAHFKEILVLVKRCPRPGVAMVAVDHLGVAATGFLAAKPGTINAGILGRHKVADLFLEGDDSLSLRHLMLIVYPAGPLDEPRLRLLDLRTMVAFRDEHGGHLDALESEGHAMVSFGRYTLFCFALSQDDRWPEDADAAWDCLPERVYFDDEAAEPDRWARKRARGRQPAPASRPRSIPPGCKSPTYLKLLPGPSLAHEPVVASDEEPRGELRIRDDTGAGRLPLGATALGRGVLLGRALRCDGSGLPVLRSRLISRVHLLVIEIGGAIYGVDVASSNGLRSQGQPTRLVRLEPGQMVTLGDQLAEIVWAPLS